MKHLLLAVPLLVAFQEGPELPRVLVLGTYHMDNPGLDYLNPVADDVLTEARQHEMDELVERLLVFEPTKVAVERPPSYQDTLDRKYRAFLDAASEPERDEVYQVAFRLAAAMGHERLFGVDHTLSLPLDPVLTRARAEHPRIAADLMERFGAVKVELDSLMKRSVLDIFREMNSRRMDEQHGVYLLFAQVGTAQDPVGADAVALWYERNLKIFGNVARLATEPTDRVLLLIGAGHGPLIREFVRQAPNLELTEAYELLEGD